MDIKLYVIILAVGLIVLVAIYKRKKTKPISKDGQVIAQLKKAGSNLKKSHEIEFFLYFPSKDAADRVVMKLIAQGFTAKVDQSANGPELKVFATKSMIPTETALVNIRNQFDAMALAEQGEYDGWGTSVVK
jgi:hypothetical protein